MSDSADDILRQMHAIRRDVGDEVQGLVRNAKTLSDWRHYVRSYPWACAGVAFAVGYLLIPKHRGRIASDMQGLVEFLRKNNLIVAGVGPAAPLTRTLLLRAATLAGPPLLRAALDVLGPRLGLGMAGAAGASPSAEPDQHYASAGPRDD